MIDSFISSLQRVALLLGFPGTSFTPEAVSSLTKYGLGNKRNLDQLIEFTGIDTRRKQVYEV